MAVHDNLRKARADRGLTQQQVADMSGIALRHYQKFESGERILTNASFCIVMKIADTMGVHIDELIKSAPNSFQRKK
jgi:transcriptional regulator with XRE-family HTH domain